MKLKDSVQTPPQMAIPLAILIADKIWKDNGQELVVTSLRDGNHSRKSMHYVDLAVDFRTRYFDTKTKHKVVRELKQALNGQYVVVVHSTHIHVEFRGLK